MEVLRSLTPLAPDCAVCLGAFDGFHRGHQRLIRHARLSCRQIAVLTFEPHPARFLAPELAPPLLQTLEQRVESSRELGISSLVLIPFDAKLARLSAHAFVDYILIRSLAPAYVVVGEDFRYGANRGGTTTDLSQQLRQAGIRCEAIPHELIESGLKSGSKIGSTQVREFIRLGEILAATDLLGRWYTLRGQVVHGDKRGRELGFPTANVLGETLSPGKGVYAVYLHLISNAQNSSVQANDQANDQANELWPAVAHIGDRPTFSADLAQTKSQTPRSQPIVEVHAIGSSNPGDLYGKKVEIVFVDKIRDEQTFSDSETLRRAIAQDIEQTKKTLLAADQRLLHLPNLCNLET